MIMGESGVGKELVTECIHMLSHRAQGPFVAINCGSIPASLIEAELFGYEKGSFTGASRSHAGVFERATGGTLLLDEVTEMPLDMQTRLLRVLETGRFYRVGGTHEIKTDVRVVAATNRNIMEATATKQFREDLMYRLGGFPAARAAAARPYRRCSAARRKTFLLSLNRAAGTHEVVCTCIRRGAVQFALERQCPRAEEHDRAEFHSGGRRARCGLAGRDPSVRSEPAAPVRPPGLHIPLGSRLDEAERWLIENTLEFCQGDKRRAANVLGCSLKTLYNKLNSYARAEEEEKSKLAFVPTALAPQRQPSPARSVKRSDSAEIN